GCGRGGTMWRRKPPTRLPMPFWNWSGQRDERRYGRFSRRLGRLLQKLHQGGAVLARADPLLRHLGAGRVGHRPDLEQLRDRLRGPHDIKLLERVGKIIAGERRDPSSENARERGTGADAVVGVQRVTGDAGAKHLGAWIPRESRKRVLGRAHHHLTDPL